MAGKNRDSLLVVAIDFGTTYSGFAFQFKHEYKPDDPTHVSSPQVWNDGKLEVTSMKTPTCLLLDANGDIDSFGFEAERKFADIWEDENQDVADWFFFRRFKMKLHNIKTLSATTNISDELGKPFPAIQVFSKSIECLKMKLLDELNRKKVSVILDEILFILTVPAIWRENAKQFMRQAAVMAGINDDKLEISLEPESASLLCQYLPMDKFAVGSNEKSLGVPGTVYMIVDLGGGTADITVHEKQRNGKLREVHSACGGPWGGTAVDGFFIQFLSNIVTPLAMSDIMHRHCGDYLELMREFEVVKRNVDTVSEKMITIKIPAIFTKVTKEHIHKDFKQAVADSPYAADLKIIGDKMKMSAALARSLFQKVMDKIMPVIDECISTVKSDKCINDVSLILMVGGFSDSPFVQQYLKKRYENGSGPIVLIPAEAGLAVLRGAVIFGRQPESISSRILRYTYGAEVTPRFDPNVHDEHKRSKDGSRCLHVFKPFKMKNDEVSEGEPVRYVYHTTNPNQKAVVLKIFCTDADNAVYTTEESFHFVGTMCLTLNKPSEELQDLDVQYVFGGTELKVVGTDVKTKSKCETVLKMVE